MKLDAFKAEKKRLLDRGQDPRAAVNRVLDGWGYDLEKRKPGVAFEDPEHPGRFTIDRELAVYMAALADRGAVLTLPHYQTRRAATRTEGEVVVSKQNRHGKALGITSNKDVFSFNVLIDDAQTITTDSVGKPKNFMLQDLDGKWHRGWSRISLIPKTDAEKALFKRTSEVSFDYFVHPNRWSSFYSRAFLLAKLSIERLTDQQKFLRAERKRLREALDVPPTEWAKSIKVGSERKETFWAFNAVLDGIEFTGEYAEYPTTKEALEDVDLLLKRIDGLLKKLRFHTRATEFAFWKHAVLETMPKDKLLAYLKGDGNGNHPRQPSWAKDAWTVGFKETPKARTFWARMDRPREGLALRWRCWQKQERVAA